MSKRVPIPFSVHECRRHNKNAMRNTATGQWLADACKEIESLTEVLSDISTTLIGYDGCNTVESLKALIDEVRGMIRERT